MPGHVLRATLLVQPPDIVHRVTRTIPAGGQIGIHHRATFAEHERIDADHHISAPDKLRRRRTPVIVLAMIRRHRRMIRTEIDHLLLAEEKHPAVRMQIDDGRRRTVEFLRNQHVSRHAKDRRGREYDLLAEVFAAIDALDDLRARRHRLRLIAQDVQQPRARSGLKLGKAGEATAEERIRIAIARRDLFNLGKQTAEVRARRIQFARRVRPECRGGIGGQSIRSERCAQRRQAEGGKEVTSRGRRGIIHGRNSSALVLSSLVWPNLHRRR